MTGGTSAAAGEPDHTQGAPVRGLTVEHRTDPLGVDADRPRFGWRTSSAGRGWNQGAYQILVASSPDRLTAGRADVWNSGRVRSADSVAVRYAGKSLAASTSYYWTVTVWDAEGRDAGTAPAAFFETGLLSGDGVTRWDGAQWIGVNFLAPVLTDEGRADLAYKLLHQDALPSWLFSVKNGATTVWERWNSYSKADGFGPVSMNSFNHYAYGAIMEWMYAYMAGIARDPSSPGFKRFLLQPHIDPTGSITQVSGVYESLYGEIRSEWAVSDGGRTLAYDALVPANSQATLRLSAASADSVREGRTPLARVDGVRFLGGADGVFSYQLPSGRYHLTARVT